MSVLIGRYTFEGPYSDIAHLRHERGLYAVLRAGALSDGIIDVGESDDVHDRVAHHDRTDCWDRHCAPSDRRYAALYLSNSTLEGRRSLEREIRAAGNPPCGQL